MHPPIDEEEEKDEYVRWKTFEPSLKWEHEHLQNPIAY